MLPILFWFHLVALVCDPRPPEERGRRGAIGHTHYERGEGWDL